MRLLVNFLFFIGFLSVPVIGGYSAAHAGAATVSPGCDPAFWKTLSARAEAEGQREMEAAQRLILKPDSILQYSCFDGNMQTLGAAGSQMFSGSGQRGSSPAAFAASGLSTTPGSGLTSAPSSVVSTLQAGACFDVTSLSAAELAAYISTLGHTQIASLLPSLPTSIKGLVGSVLGIDLNFPLPGPGTIIGMIIPSFPLPSLPSISSVLPSMPSLSSLSSFLNVSGLISLPSLSSFIPSIPIPNLKSMIPSLSLGQLGQLIPSLSTGQLGAILPSVNLSSIIPSISVDGLKTLLPKLPLPDLKSALPGLSLSQIKGALPSLSLPDLQSVLPSLSGSQLGALLSSLDPSKLTALLPSINLASLIPSMSLPDILSLLPKLPDFDLKALIPTLPSDLKNTLAAALGINVAQLLNLSAADIKAAFCKAKALGMLDQGGDLDRALDVLVTSTNSQYISDNFQHKLMGGQFGSAGILCAGMGAVGNFARCQNFDGTLFLTLLEMPTKDPRNIPYACPGAGARTAKWNAMLATAFPVPGGVGALDAVNDYNGLIKSYGDTSCGTADPILTGVTVISGGGDHEDAVCTIPGCYYDPAGNGSCKP